MSRGDTVTKRMIRYQTSRGRVRDLGEVCGVRSYIIIDPELREEWFGDNIQAMVVERSILYRSTTAARSRLVREHERRHIEQRDLFGQRWFDRLYWLGCCLTYWGNPLEIDAGLAALRAVRRARQENE